MSEKNKIALVGGTLIDGSGKDPVADSLILINGNTIEAVGTKSKIKFPEDYKIIDVGGKTVMPGMIDCHVHLINGPSELVIWKWGLAPPMMEHSLPMVGLKVYARAKETLEMGFTTLRDVGDVGYAAVALRDAVDQGIVEGPRIVACGPYLNPTGGHGDALPPWLVRTDVVHNVADGVDGVLKAVRRSIQMNTDWIKFTPSGAGLSNTWGTNFRHDEMKTLIDEAHNKGRRVAGHCVSAAGNLIAVQLGIDSVEHGLDLTEEIVELMLQNGTYLVPTLYASISVAERGDEFGVSPEMMAGAKKFAEKHKKSFNLALKAGVKIAMGTDAGFAACLHGTNACELALMVQNGMTPLQAIVAATSGAADCLDMLDKLGTIEKGKLADIVVIDGDPLTDILMLQNKEYVGLVMKDGVVYVDRITSQ